MIVDDHVVIRRMLREVFEAQDLEVCEVANGAEGVQEAQDVRPSLIILDLPKQVMNGLEAARALKLLMPRIPLLMFTNNAGSWRKRLALRASLLWSPILTPTRRANCSPTQRVGLEGARVQRAS